MNIDKFLNTVKYLNFLIENVSSDDIDNVRGSIERTKEKNGYIKRSYTK